MMTESTAFTTDAERRCDHCRFAVLVDTGYSNWTVMGTDLFCSKRLHPEDGFDIFYGVDEKLKFAVSCDAFEGGDPLMIDCDHERLDELTPEEREMWEAIA